MLCFYTEGVGDEGDHLIRDAEEKSLDICEKCGKPGTARKGGWIKALCDDHADGREPFFG